MPSRHKPRSGSLQFWPRVRAKRQTARIRNWTPKKGKLGGFPAYKAGMTHVQYWDTNPNSTTKNTHVSIPVTILECPPVRVVGVRTYTKAYMRERAGKDFIAPNLDKFVQRTINVPKQPHSLDSLSGDGVTRVTIFVATQPHKIGFKKKPEILEVALGGSVDDQIAQAKELFGKEVTVDQVFQEGEQVDSRAVTRGKGFQGPIKRFGLHFRGTHKSEKGRRAPGSVGAWHGPKNWTVPHAGQMGYHQRMELNKWIVKIGTNPEEVNQKGGITHYGNVKNQFMLVKGSLLGPKKRLITLTHACRPKPQTPKKPPQITYISTASKQ